MQSGRKGSKQKANAAPVAVTPVEKKARSRRPLWIGIAVLALLAAGFGAYQYLWANSDAPPKFKNEVEKTRFAETPLLQLLKPEETGIDFQNLITESEENNITKNINKYNGGGVAVADINNDRLQDLYFICSNGKNKMYLNEGGFKFKDITETSGLASEDGFETGVTAVDINNDGFLDLYVCRAGPTASEDRRNKLFINNGNLTFSEQSKAYGIDDISASNSANFFDYDLDGDLDLYLLNYPLELVYAHKIDVHPGPNGAPTPNTEPKKPYDSDRFYRNDGGKFTDASKEAGIWNFAFGLSVSVSDFNRDGYPDVYVGNDFIQPDFLYINNQDGTFTNQLSKYFKHVSQHTMGTDLSDFDNDGLIDLMAMDMYPNNNLRLKTLQTTNTQSKYLSMAKNGYFEPVVRNVCQRNNGNGTFSDIACLSGVYRTDWSWSALFSDLDNDGWKDLYFTNGYRREITNVDFINFFTADVGKMNTQQYKEKYGGIEGVLNSIPTMKLCDFVYKNTGDWQFEDKGGDWMTLPGTWSCGAAWADLDNDGDLDMVVSNLEDPAFVYKNLSRDQNKGNYVQFKFSGAPGNAFGVGASVLLKTGNTQQYQELNPTKGIFSSVEHLIHFGLGNTTQIDQVQIRWPDGKTQLLNNVPANQRIVVKYQDAGVKVATLVPFATEKGLVQDQTPASGVNFVHTENDYNDFEQFPLNPWMESELGPLVAKGDVNNDGLDDFFIGNAFQSPANLYIQTPDGRFKPSSDNIWAVEKVFEDQGAVFFDFDRDGDQDLFVVSGGVEALVATRTQAWQNRLYLNVDGKGTFARVNPTLIPEIREACMRVMAHDYDGDGDQDIFVGGRAVADKWPLTPQSYILRNDNNRMVDVTDEVGGDFAKCGMITDFSCQDLDGDGKEEMVVVGEWMPISIFKLLGSKYVDVTAKFGLENSNGIWYRLSVADLDQDGDLDLVTGNLGLNTRYTASEKAPLSCYAKDFDKNGTLDPIMTFFEDGKEYPMVQKDVITKQMPILKKRFLYASKYGLAEIDDVWPKKDLDAALNLKAYSLETCWWENKGGKFIRHTLPRSVQAAPIQGILVHDFNQDGKLDLMLAGNKNGFEVETGPCDAGTGALLLGDGTGAFTRLDNTQSGFWGRGSVRDLSLLRAPSGKIKIVVANNNAAAQLYGN